MRPASSAWFHAAMAWLEELGNHSRLCVCGLLSDLGLAVGSWLAIAPSPAVGSIAGGKSCGKVPSGNSCPVVSPIAATGGLSPELSPSPAGGCCSGSILLQELVQRSRSRSSFAVLLHFTVEVILLVLVLHFWYTCGCFACQRLASRPFTSLPPCRCSSSATT